MMYTPDELISDINIFKTNPGHLKQFKPAAGKGNMEYVINKKNDPTFFKNNLCVFVDFDIRIDYKATRIYLGQLLSSDDDLMEYANTVESLQFTCDLLYSHDTTTVFKPEHSFRFHNSSWFGCVIGFLPLSDKDYVLDKMREVA